MTIRKISAALCAATLALAATTGAVWAKDAASDAASNKASEQKMEQIVEKSSEVEDGAVQPSTGRAEPVENWMGCPPDADEAAEHCEPEPEKPETGAQ